MYFKFKTEALEIINDVMEVKFLPHGIRHLHYP